MAISTGDAIHVFGTTDNVINITTDAITTTSFSDESDDITEWTNTEDAPLAMAILDATMSGNPTAGTTIDLYARLMNISDTTDDANIPDASFTHFYLGSFPMDSATTAQIMSIPISLPNTYTSQVYHFLIHNNATGVSINTGSTVDIAPITYGPV